MPTKREDAPTPENIRRNDFQRRLEQSRRELIRLLEEWIHVDRAWENHGGRSIQIRTGWPGTGHDKEFLSDADTCIEEVIQAYKAAGWNITLVRKSFPKDEWSAQYELLIS
jgi:hypothetical protein